MRSVLYLILAALILVECEFLFVRHMPGSMHSWNLPVALVLAGPLLWGLVQRRTLRRWEETENMSALAAVQ